MEPPGVIIYTTSWCGYCAAAIEMLDELDIPFVDKDIERDAIARSEYRKKSGGRKGVPLIDVDGQILRGFSRGRLTMALARAGY